jgi:hypothetical protein
MKFDTRRNAVGVILVIQKDQAAAIFETAGRANANRLSNNLDPVTCWSHSTYWPCGLFGAARH